MTGVSGLESHNEQLKEEEDELVQILQDLKSSGVVEMSGGVKFHLSRLISERFKARHDFEIIVSVVQWVITPLGEGKKSSQLGYIVRHL